MLAIAMLPMCEPLRWGAHALSMSSDAVPPLASLPLQQQQDIPLDSMAMVARKAL